MEKKQQYILTLTAMAVSMSTAFLLTKKVIFFVLLVFITLLDVIVFAKVK